MSGISIGVAVVEAPKISGALITAGHAADIFSRYVFDFPEKIDVQKAFGEGDKKKKKALRKKSTEGLSNEALLVYNNLVKQEFTVDDLSALSLDGAVLLSALTELEMERFISSLPGGLYRKID